MTDVKHTPGPWYINQKYCIGPRPRADDQSDGMFRPLADVYGVNRDANARLIAAAPDLLDALSVLLNVYSGPDRALCCDGRDCTCMGSTRYQEAEHYARAAIAKAEGRS